MASMSWKGTRVLADHIKAEASIIIVLGPMSLTNPVNRIPPSISEARRLLLSPSSPSYTFHWGSIGALKYILCKSYDADFGKFCIFPLMSFPDIPITFSNQIRSSISLALARFRPDLGFSRRPGLARDPIS